MPAKPQNKPKRTPPLANATKVGRLKKSVADAIGRRCADIYITDNYVAHIEHRHGVELEALGIGAFDYVKMIADSYNSILEGTNDSILLVVRTNSDIQHVAAISLNYCVKKGVWEIKTAQPRRTKELSNKTILWQTCKRSG